MCEAEDRRGWKVPELCGVEGRHFYPEAALVGNRGQGAR